MENIRQSKYGICSIHTITTKDRRSADFLCLEKHIGTLFS